MELKAKRYFISGEELEQEGRSFPFLLKNRLCYRCQGKAKEDVNWLLNSIKQCCSTAPEFFSPRLPLKETIFRLFLSNGNQPLTLGDIGEGIKKRKGINYPLQTIEKILDNDRYYGFKRFEGG